MKVLRILCAVVRTIVLAIYLVVSVLLSLLFLLGSKLFSKNRWLSADRVATCWAKSMLFVAGVRVECQGAPIAGGVRGSAPYKQASSGDQLKVLQEEENRREREETSQEAVFYVGNHTSLFDVLIAIAMLPSPKAYVSKIENKKIPGLNWWMTELGCVFIDRDNLRQQVKVLKTAEENMKKGLSYLVFPEGTRSKDGNVLEFKAGAFKIAQRAGVPVQPIGFAGVRQVLRKGSLLVHSSKVVLNVGEVLPPEDFPKDTKTVAEKMRAEVERLTKEAERDMGGISKNSNPSPNNKRSKYI